jgi:hypothetical protein
LKSAGENCSPWLTWCRWCHSKLEGIYGYVYAFLARAWKHDDFSPVHVRVKGTGKEAVKVYSPPPEMYRFAARLLLLQEAQEGL